MSEEEIATEADMERLLVEHGVSRSDARMALELAAHAKSQAVETVKTVSEAAPIHLRMLVTALAIDTIAASLNSSKVEDGTIKTLALGIMMAAAFNKESAEHGTSDD